MQHYSSIPVHYVWATFFLLVGLLGLLIKDRAEAREDFDF